MTWSPSVISWRRRAVLSTGGGLCHSGLAECDGPMAWVLCVLGTSRLGGVGLIPVAHIVGGQAILLSVAVELEESEESFICLLVSFSILSIDVFAASFVSRLAVGLAGCPEPFALTARSGFCPSGE